MRVFLRASLIVRNPERHSGGIFVPLPLFQAGPEKRQSEGRLHPELLTSKRIDPLRHTIMARDVSRDPFHSVFSLFLRKRASRAAFGAVTRQDAPRAPLLHSTLDRFTFRGPSCLLFSCYPIFGHYRTSFGDRLVPGTRLRTTCADVVRRPRKRDSVQARYRLIRSKIK